MKALSHARSAVISIHAPTRGATVDAALELNSIRVFQSTLLQEERRVPFIIDESQDIISIHAPTRGATVVSFAIFGAVIFQSTLLQEERRFFMI